MHCAKDFTESGLSHGGYGGKQQQTTGQKQPGTDLATNGNREIDTPHDKTFQGKLTVKMLILRLLIVFNLNVAPEGVLSTQYFTKNLRRLMVSRVFTCLSAESPSED
jgi:hypothetical protein